MEADVPVFMLIPPFNIQFSLISGKFIARGKGFPGDLRCSKNKACRMAGSCSRMIYSHMLGVSSKSAMLTNLTLTKALINP